MTKKVLETRDVKTKYLHEATTWYELQIMPNIGGDKLAIIAWHCRIDHDKQSKTYGKLMFYNSVGNSFSPEDMNKHQYNLVKGIETLY